MLRTVNLCEAKTHLSTLVEEAAVSTRRKPSGFLKFTYIADDFNEPDPEIERLFEGA